MVDGVANIFVSAIFSSTSGSFRTKTSKCVTSTELDVTPKAEISFNPISYRAYLDLNQLPEARIEIF